MTFPIVTKQIADEILKGLLAARGLPAPRSGWLKMLRTKHRLSTRQVGKRLGVSHQAITQFEQAEREGRITLASLRRVADAIGCELVYGVVPKAKSAAASPQVANVPAKAPVSSPAAGPSGLPEGSLLGMLGLRL